VALAGIDDALEGLEGGAAGGEALAGSGGLGFGVLIEKGLCCGLPEIGFGEAQAAQFVVDETALVEVGGGVEFVVFGGEL
jgi:hypothetical protein